MQPIRRSDFSGGIAEVYAAEDFPADAVAVAQGLVLDSPVSLRSQWPLQSFGADGDWYSVRGFSSTADYLIGIKPNGTVWWTVAPAANALTPTVTWTQFTSITPSLAYKFIGEIPFQKSTQTVTNLASGESGSVEVTLYGKNGLLINSNPLGATPSVIYESAANTLSIFTYSKVYPRRVPHPTIPNLYISDSDVMPNANCGVLWGDRLVLADILWFGSTGTDQVLGSTPGSPPVRYKNAMWFSEPGLIDTFDPLNVVIPCSSDAAIVGVAVIDTGLLVFTTNSTGRDGVILLRGTPTNFRIEILRTGLCAAPRLSDVYRPFLTQWADAGTVVFIDREGGVWQTNGSSIARLDPSSLISYGALEVQGNLQTVLGIPPSDRDHVATVGPWLFAARGRRLLCFRSFGQSGAWTELVLPAAAPPPPFFNEGVESLTSLGGAMYFVRNGRLFRFTVGYTYGPRGTYTDRAAATTTPLTVRLATPTIAAGQNGDAAHHRTLWHRVGVRGRGRQNTNLTSITVHAGPALQSFGSSTTVATHTFTVSRFVQDRFEYVVPAGIGFSVEASATFTFTGDVEVESVTFWVSGGEPAR